jgi:WD40 repeat protein
MDVDDADPAHDQFAELLAAYDEALAAGSAAAPPTETSLCRQVAARLERSRACLDRLEEMWPRAPGAVPQEPAVAQGDEGPFPTSVGRAVQLGRFRIVRELGRGGCGIVFLAFDPTLRRHVALKMPRPEASLTREARQRFLREAQAAAVLDHPNLVPVYETGELGPIGYIVSAYCPGPTLAAWLKARSEPVGAQEAVQLVLALAEGVEHAHSRGVLHRDLKPGNVLLQKDEGGRMKDESRPDASSLSSVILHPSSFVPKITDFGMAKFVEGEGDETRSGTVLGTPRYMAPEQVEARRREIGPATDVYALGAILYEVLTGRPPLQAETDLATLRLVLSAEPVPLRRLRPEVSRDLEAVCRKCLEKDPRRRYPTAAALAEDLRRLLAGDSTLARPAGVMTHVRKQVRRHRAALAGVVLVLATVLSLWGGWRWYDEAARARVRGERDARRKQYVQSLRSAQVAQESGQPERARELLDGQRPGPGGSDLRGFEWYHLWQLCQAAPFPVLKGHSGSVRALMVSPDGKTLASAGDDQWIKLWDVATGRDLATLRGHTLPVWGLAFSPRGDLLASSGHIQMTEPGELKLWDVATGKLRATLDDATIRVKSGLAFCPDGKTLAAAGGEPSLKTGQVRLWDVATAQVRRDLKGFPGNWVHCVAFAPDGRTLAAGGASSEIQLWDLDTGQARTKLTGHTHHVHSVTFSPDGQTLVSGSWDTTLRLWDLTTFQERPPLQHRTGPVWCTMAFAPDGKTLAAGGETGTIKLWDVASGRDRATLTGHTAAVRAVMFTCDGRTLFSGSDDKTVRRWWDPAGGSARASLKGHTAEAWGVAFAPDDRTLATAGDDHLVRLWNPATGHELATLSGPSSLVGCVAFSPDGQLLASGDYDGTVRIYETATQRQRARLEGHRRLLRSLAFSPDGRTLATASNDFTVRLWDVATATELAKLEGHRNIVRSVAFAPDGRTLASASEDQTVRLWDVATRQLRLEFADTGQVWCLAFAPDGRTFATGNNHGTIRLWDAATGAERATLNGHLQGVKSVAFTPDGKRLASGSDDQTIRLWDVEGGQELLTLKAHLHRVNGVAFSSDGQTLASVSHDGAVKLWQASAEE